jgi:DNA-binding MarR family transcriptional regulator
MANTIKTEEPDQAPGFNEGLSADPAHAGVSLAHLLHRATQQADHALHLEVAGKSMPVHVTIRQYVTLRAVADSETINQTGLTEATGIDRSTLADIVRRLQEAGLIERQRSPHDRRSYAIGLRLPGVTALSDYEDAVARADRRVLGSVPSRLRAPLVEALTAIIKAVPAE